MWRFVGGKSPNSFTNQTEQENYGKVEMKCDLEVSGNTNFLGSSGNFEGGQINLRYPRGIDSTQKDQDKRGWVDMYYDYNKIYTQYRCGQVRIGHKGRVGIAVSEVGHHTIYGHTYLWDSLNNSVIVMGNPGDDRDGNLVIRHSPTKTTYQNNLLCLNVEGQLKVKCLQRQRSNTLCVSLKTEVICKFLLASPSL